MDQTSANRMYRNVGLLALCQALYMSSTTLVVASTALVGAMLAPDPGFATLAFGLQWVGTMSTSYPAAIFMKHVGRRVGLSSGIGIGMLGAILCTIGIMERNFALFCAGSFFLGSFNAFGQQYRFAAADASNETFRPRAISLVVAGGVVAGFTGPSLAAWTRDMLPGDPFAFSYASIIVLQLLTLAVLSFIDIPRGGVQDPSSGASRSERSLLEIASQKNFIVAVSAGVIGYATMNLIMAVTPLEMAACGFGFGATSSIIQWHVVGMFAPSFITGNLISRFGVNKILLAGALLQIVCIATNLSGSEYAHFWISLVALGVGWNFLFVGATTLLTQSTRPEDRAKAQGLNDMLIFTIVATTALSSGYIQDRFGWDALNLATAPLLLITVVAIVWLMNQSTLARARG